MSEKKIIIITGSGRGIGRSVAIMSGERGYQAVILARTKKAIERTGKEVLKFGGQHFDL